VSSRLAPLVPSKSSFHLEGMADFSEATVKGVDGMVRNFSREILLTQIIPYLDDKVGFLEEVNDRSPLFRDIKICPGIVTRPKKKIPEICGKLVDRGRSNYCINCIKKLKKNGKTSISLSKIGDDDENLYWNQENDHIYRLEERTLTLIGIRDGAKISYEIDKKMERDAEMLGIKI